MNSEPVNEQRMASHSAASQVAIETSYSRCSVTGKVAAVRRSSNTSTNSNVSYGSGATTSCSSSLEDSNSLTNPPCTVSGITKAFQNEDYCSLSINTMSHIPAGQLPSKPTSPSSVLSSLASSRKHSCTRTGGVAHVLQLPVQTSRIQYTENKANLATSGMEVDENDREEEHFAMSFDGENHYDNFVDLEATASPGAVVVGEGLGMVVLQAGGQYGSIDRMRTRSMSTSTDVELSPQHSGRASRSGTISRKESISEQREESLMFDLED